VSRIQHFDASPCQYRHADHHAVLGTSSLPLEWSGVVGLRCQLYLAARTTTRASAARRLLLRDKLIGAP
jgi:hypothetical protein